MTLKNKSYSLILNHLKYLFPFNEVKNGYGEGIKIYLNESKKDYVYIFKYFKIHTMLVFNQTSGNVKDEKRLVINYYEKLSSDEILIKVNKFLEKFILTELRKKKIRTLISNINDNTSRYIKL